MLNAYPLEILPVTLSTIAGYTDWRFRRIPNWLTIPGLFLGIILSTLVRGWPGTKDSLVGAGLGLGLLLPFVIIRALGAGDWKLVGALGAFLGPQALLLVLMVTILANGVMAVAMIIWKKRVGRTARNFVHMLAAVAQLKMPGREFTLDNPDAVKVPFGVAVAFAMMVYTVSKFWVRA